MTKTFIVAVVGSRRAKRVSLNSTYPIYIFDNPAFVEKVKSVGWEAFNPEVGEYACIDVPDDRLIYEVDRGKSTGGDLVLKVKGWDDSANWTSPLEKFEVFRALMSEPFYSDRVYARDVSDFYVP